MLQVQIDATLHEECMRRVGDEMTGATLGEVARIVSAKVGVPVIVVVAMHLPDCCAAYAVPT